MTQCPSDPTPPVLPEMEALDRKGLEAARVAWLESASDYTRLDVSIAAAIRAYLAASAPEQAVKGLWDLHRAEHRKLGELLTDKSPEGREASNWQGGRVNGIGAAIDALSLKENIPEPVAETWDAGDWEGCGRDEQRADAVLSRTASREGMVLVTGATVQTYKEAFGDYIAKVSDGLVLPPSVNVGEHATKYALEAVFAALAASPNTGGTA